ncbi:MAG: hypothetical protein LBE92_12265 [Chryseobacterium sp.]|jgi:hypothetical protein|uniref:hypothetical protein n=1 Tax=Chryseobacterium sp. TaxID=1871047 RepID=UPI002826FFB7|nr:hypothetical protein [Chryseobacterium sp.]MDR2236890.1 hypothetical protein [Chryseobacterium sp.]
MKGRKLNKKELRTIAGGLIDCMPPRPCPPYPESCDPDPDTNGCSMISPFCGQKICRPQ